MPPAIDITGQRFGRLVAVSYSHSDGVKRYWNCRCDCGTERAIVFGSLRTGMSKSCGCLRADLGAARTVDLTGRRFGRFVVVKAGDKKRHWVCRCDCGAERLVHAGNLRTGASASCGCLRKRSGSRANRLTNNPTYRSWNAMHNRCRSSYFQSHNYADRGIAVCERWSSFSVFLQDVGERPPGKTLDRVNGALGYAPDNVRWATPTEQANNRRGNRLITFAGTFVDTAAGWGMVTGLGYNTVRDRIRRGWTPEEALLTPKEHGSAA